MIYKSMFPLFSLYCAISDLLKGRIDLRICGGFGLIGLISIMAGSHHPDLPAFIPGFLLLLLALLSGERIGYGDALYFLLAALFLKLDQLILLFASALLLCCLISLLLLVRTRFSKEAALPDALPFLSITGMSTLLLLGAGVLP